MVAAIIEQNKDEIAALCRTYRIRALWVFGSAVTEAFDPEQSDLDFLVDLGDYSDDYASRFFTLRRELERVTGRDVDLVSAGGPESGWFREEVEATKVSVYDARYDQLVA
ncbi:MAG TPA: nucleotidyltransferase domain-containing protein [Thermomicrobiales bacterium]|nr:nucleotidyltransferase domain-containing protein [Thermomicrobiales bacterium]